MPPPLQTYESTASNATGSTGPTAQPALFEQQTMAPGRGLMQLGASLFEAGQRRADQDEAMWIAETEGMARSHWAKRFEELETTGGDGFTQSFKAEYNNYIKGLIKSAPSARAAQKLGLQLQNFGTGLYNRAAKKEASARLQELSDKIDTTIGYRANELLVKGGYDNLEQSRAELTDLIKSMSGRIPSPQITIDKADKILVKTALEGLIQNGEAGKALSEIDSQKFAGLLDPQELVSIRARAKNAAEQVSIVNSAAAKKFSDNMLSLMENQGNLGSGYPDIETAVKQYGQYFQGSDRYDEKISEFRSGLEMVQATYGVLQDVKSAPPSDAQNILDRIKPTANDPNYADKMKMYEYAQKAVANYQKLLDVDPVSALSNTPMVQAAMSDYKVAEQEIAQNPNLDPKKLNDARERVYSSLLAAQAVAGVPGYKQTVISNATAESISSQLRNAGPGEVEQVLKGLQNTYGSNFQGVLGSLARLPNDVGIDASYLLVAQHLNMPYIGDLIKSIQTPKSELDKLIPDNRTREKIESDVLTAPETTDFIEAMRDAEAPVSFINGTVKAAQSYAKYKYGFQGRGVKESIKQASETVFASQFHYAKINGRKFIVPKRLKNGYTFSSEELENIELNLQAKLAEITMLARPEYLTSFTSVKNPSEEFKIAADRFINNIPKLGYFSTASDFSGVFFTMDQDPQYGTSRSRVNFNDMASGRPKGPIYFSYEDLSQRQFDPKKAKKLYLNIKASQTR